MKKLNKLFIIISALVAIVLGSLCAACTTPERPAGTDGPGELVDYVSQLKLDLNSNTKKQEVTIRQHIDGDTTHFNPKYNSTIATNDSSDFADTDGYIKARYIAINTPESTGKIEPWGGKASKFTKGKLDGAESIIVESDDDKWNIDSSGSFRYVVWVWYKPKGEAEYRNLNLEILQEGFAFGSSVSSNRYGTLANNAMAQARAHELHVFSKEKDDEFPYGAATPITLKELRCNIEDYVGKKIKVDGVVASQFNNSVYIEDYDAELNTYFGMAVYYGYQIGAILDVLKIGNRVSVVGVITEFSGTYQISDVSYNEYDDVPSNSTIVSEGHEAAFAEVSGKAITSGTLKVTVDVDTKDEDGNVTTETIEKEIAYGEAVLNTTVTLKGLTVTDVYTTKTGNSAGAMSITCSTSDGGTIVVRTDVLKKADGSDLTAADFPVGTKLEVKGIVEYYVQQGQTVGQYQVKAYRTDFLKVVG